MPSAGWQQRFGSGIACSMLLCDSGDPWTRNEGICSDAFLFMGGLRALSDAPFDAACAIHQRRCCALKLNLPFALARQVLLLVGRSGTDMILGTLLAIHTQRGKW